MSSGKIKWITGNEKYTYLCKIDEQQKNTFKMEWNVTKRSIDFTFDENDVGWSVDV
jgi:hypothetical protein